MLEATVFARQAGFDEPQSQMIATAVSELTRNILKYAGSGTLTVRRTEGAGRDGIEVEAADQGPGIEDTSAAMRDHFSSGGTLGLGLPGVKRMMDEFSLISEPGRGTVVQATKWR